MEIPYTVTARPDTGLWNAKVGIWLFLASEVMLFGGLFSAYIFLRIAAEHWPHGLLNVPIGFFNTVVLITSSITVVLAWAALKMREFRKYQRYIAITVACGCMFLLVKSYEYNEKFHHYGVVLKSGQEITGHLAMPVEEAQKASYLLLYPDSEESKTPLYQLRSVFVHKKEEGEPLRIEKKDIRWWSNFVPKHSTYFAVYFTLTGLHGLHVLGGTLVLAYFWLPGSALYRTNPEHLANRVEVAGLFWHFVDLVWIFLFPLLYLL
ncbi:cytochrome c oxidase subunit 3 [Candidatus Methylacidithermus pantelleriae]|uniref:Cytochrome c oxidase subunit 3 n=1 Tax=Candidatus Methylacidithermus pantelleriae TaxID=2744239 RepID=A0A8J2FRC2_9BACT|nr:cytochrome c oxidase subunit 3 [Candidatus Methylacidithermus pantelleriae]CAF0689625.1 Cytochrome c oxidase subunit 3 [Candidatus Methylacidithermus pantelleriae]